MSDALGAEVAAAVRARERLVRRPLGRTIAALAAAARRWGEDAELRARLPAASGLSPAMIAAVVALAAEMLHADTMTALVEAEWGAGAAARPVPPGPRLVAHVLASNVPALALPAIALSCLAGAAVVVKSGRHDPFSAAAYVRALGAIDDDLAATVVAAYWRGGEIAPEAAALAPADVVVATGGDAAVTALAARVGARLVAHGPRTSAVGLGRNALAEPDALAAAVARDVVLHDQRGCLSPQVVWVETGGRVSPGVFAERLAAALAATAEALPPGPGASAASGLVRAEAEWDGAATVLATPGGTVIVRERPALAPTAAPRTVYLHPIDDLAALATVLPAGTVEGVAVAGEMPEGLAQRLRSHGVARICPPGRLQRPRLSWPRGQRAPLGALLGRVHPPLCEIET